MTVLALCSNNKPILNTFVSQSIGNLKEKAGKIHLFNNNQTTSFNKSKMANQIKTSQEEFSNRQMRSIGSWSFNQDLLYVIFLQKNKVLMISKKKRRNVRIFDLMSEFIHSRNPLQCRSHHQKLIQKYGEVKKIISNFKKYISKEQYKNKFMEMSGETRYRNQTTTLIESLNQGHLDHKAEQQTIKVQDNVSVVKDNKLEEIQKIYNLYMLQMANHLNFMSQLGCYYSGLQIMP